MKQIPGFPNYSVTKDGRVWSHRSKKWLSLIKNNRDYLQVNLCNRGRRICAIHRLVLETFVGPCPDNMECRHLNGNRQDNRLNNLKWGTHSENQQDAVGHKTHYTSGKYGEDHPVTKLSNQDRRLIIYQYSTGLFSHSELGRSYNTSRKTISRLVNGKLWPFINVVKVKKVAHV
ncbi:hypothetical protein LCGC14_1782640 [marine sediment metagenome]|uniref:HNH nuclease domain-containing protein n=1 Tax=marine sediment metagenome TaxID=412755 RepID=A0A0F9JUH3_9ZZZZ